MERAPYRSTFTRLLGFLRPYRVSLVVSIVLAAGSQAAQIALIWVTAARRPGDPAARLARAVDLRLDDRRPRRAQGSTDGRPPADLRPAGARRGDGPAQRPVRAARPALVRVLRPSPDRTADVAGDRRPPGRPLLPRLRPDLPVPELPHRALRHGGALLRRVAARPDRAGDHAPARRAGLPLQPHRPPDAARRAAEARRRRHGRGGEHRRRPRREGVRPGAGRGGEVRPSGRRRSSGRRCGRTASAPSTCR